MTNTQEILIKRFAKLDKHFEAIRGYLSLIIVLIGEKDVFTVSGFNSLRIEEKALFDAFLKRFASIKDFLGGKIFPLLLEVSGIGSLKMSEVLDRMEKEEIIDSMENWITLREIRNELEHDYPEDLLEALQDLKYCIENFEKLEGYYHQATLFARRYIA